MVAPELFTTLLQQATRRGGRSTALYPLGWALAILASSLIAGVYAHGPAWLIVALSVGCGVLLVAYLGAYFFFMIRDPDALRSEHYALSKMQIEKSQIGDTSRGFSVNEPFNAVQAVLPETRQLPAPSQEAK